MNPSHALRSAALALVMVGGAVLPVRLAGQAPVPNGTGAVVAARGRGDGALLRAVAIADSLVGAAVKAERIPGAVLLVAQNGKVLHEKAYGWAQLYDYGMKRLAKPRSMKTSTVFDLASVTKVMATTYAVMLLSDRGRIDLDAPVYTYLPEFRGAHFDSITVRHLLTHSSGLVQWQPLYYHAHTAAETFAHISSMPLQWGVGEGRHYSDLGFMLLGYLVERVSGTPLDRFVLDSVYRPLGLRHTTFLPRRHGLRDFAATEHGNGYERHMVYDSAFGYYVPGDPKAWDAWRRYTLVGEVNDGNSFYANGGVAGHAGLFSTASDLAVLLQVLLDGGVHGGTRLLKAETVSRFMTRDRFGHNVGWMFPRGAPEGSFSHGGFTGTYVLGVPKYRLAVVLLTNRQNAGTNSAGYFTNVGPLEQGVTRALLDGAQSDVGEERGRN